MCSRNPRSFCKLGKLAARPGSCVAVDRRGAAHCVVANACAANLDQSVGMCAVIRKRRRDRCARECAFRIGVFLDIADPTVIIILVYKGFVKLYHTKQAPPVPHAERAGVGL